MIIAYYFYIIPSIEQHLTVTYAVKTLRKFIKVYNKNMVNSGGKHNILTPNS